MGSNLEMAPTSEHCFMLLKRRSINQGWRLAGNHWLHGFENNGLCEGLEETGGENIVECRRVEAGLTWKYLDKGGHKVDCPREFSGGSPARIEER